MNEENQPVRLTANGITIEVDLHQVLTAIDPQGRYLGYDPETDEDHFVQSSLEQELVHATSLELVKTLRKDVKNAVLTETRDAIKAEVEIVVRETLGAPVQQVSDWGQPTGTPMSLRDLIGEEAKKALKMPELRDGYGYGRDRPSMVQEIIRKEIQTAFTKDLKEVVDEAQKQALAAVRDQAGQVIAEAVRRATPGL